MTEQELRELVRRLVHDRLRTTPHDGFAHHPDAPAPLIDVRHHPSHATFRVSDGAETGGPCVIEPRVSCDHCGYCKSMGH
jgi:hypothetical protein